MTEPLTPADCDLQDFPFMPLQVARLRDSDLAATAHPEACWYAVLLWAASWHQLPAASLPDDDAVLTRLCGLGRDLRTFRKHKAAAMRGFVLCADGRLYHPVVAEQAVTAWEGKLQQRWRTECARIKKHNQRHGTELVAPTFEQFIAGGAVPDPSPQAVHEDSAECPGGQTVQEKGTGTGTDIEEPDGSSSGADAPPKGKPKKRSPETPLPEAYPDAAAIAEGQAKLRESGLNVDADRLAERFRNHALQNDRRCRDWRAAWRNWVLIEVDRLPKPATGPSAEIAFAGPADVIQAVVGATDPQRAATLLGRCSWQDVPERALVSSNNVVVNQLREGDVWKALRDIGVDVRLERAA